jgi:hypothetical protein
MFLSIQALSLVLICRKTGKVKNKQKKREVARFPYTKNSENRLKSKAIQGGLRFFYGIQEVCNRA